MLEPPQLALLNEECQLHSKFLPNNWILLSLKQSPAFLQRKLIPIVCISNFVLYLEFVTLCEWNIDQLINGKLCLTAQLPFHHNRMVESQQYCRSSSDPSVNFTLHSFLNCEQNSEIPELIHLKQHLTPNLERATYPFRLRTMNSDFVVLILLLFTPDYSSECWRSQNDDANRT